MPKKTGIFVPARLSSQRLPNKQILPIGNTCMFDICCSKLNELDPEINKYVLIYDKELIDIAAKYPNIEIILRDEETAKAETPLVYIFKDILDVEDDYLMFLNPCLIFLSPSTIEGAIHTFNNMDEAEYATSVKELKNWIIDDEGNNVNQMDYDKLTTKEIIPWYQTAHCFHIFNKNRFLEDGLMLIEGFLPIIIPNAERDCIDIDTFEDYEFAKWKWEKEMQEMGEMML